MSGGGGSGNLSNINKCGLTEILLFLFAVVFGTCTSICSKTMMSMTGTNGSTVDGVESFQKPIFQTFGMFVGMIFGLVMHWACVRYAIPFPGYDHQGPTTVATSGLPTTESTSLVSGGGGRAAVEEKKKEKREVEVIPTSMYFLLAIPAAFDLGATALW